MEKDFYEAMVMLDSNRDLNLTEVLDQLRAACRITIVAVEGPAVALSAYKEQSKLRVKFMKTKQSVRDDLDDIKRSVHKIDGIYSFRILKVKKVDFRGQL